jgi:cyclase
VGGGIRTVEHVQRLLQVGADKVVVNTAAVQSPDLIRDIARRFGSQCVVVSIDARRYADGVYETYSHAGTVPAGKDPVSMAREAEAAGAGEILVTSIDRDGTMAGYDVELTRVVADSVTIPVIASGGAGTYEHMAEVIREGHSSAVAAASLFHFTHQTPAEAKRYLKERGFVVRA